jgi:DNA invertase Pin-like site-specific DNA recombinase
VNLALYLRVSTDNQTVENQRQQLTKEALHRNATIVRTYTDDAISGAKTRAERPGLDQLLTDAISPDCPFDTVMVTALDRLGRSLIDILANTKILAENNIQFIMLREQIDTTTPAGKLQLSIFGALAEYEREIIRERINAGIARAKSQGKNCGTLPYPNDVRARVRALAREGIYTDQEIANQVQTISRKGKVLKPISKMTVRRIRHEVEADIIATAAESTTTIE